KLAIDAGETVHFNSGDLEDGNTEKGLTGSTGPTGHDWRLMLSSDLKIEVLAYIRTPDGFLTSMHDIVPADAMEHHSDDMDHEEGGEGDHDDAPGDDDHGDDGHGDDSDGAEYEYTYRVAIFNPARNMNQRSQLRITNPGHDDTDVRITATDDHGNSTDTHDDADDDHGDSDDDHGHTDDDHGDDSDGHDDEAVGHVSLSIPAGTSRTLTALELESGHEDFEGALGTGAGKWQLLVKSEKPVTLMSLLLSPAGHLTNLSTAPHRQPRKTAAEVFHESIHEPIVQAKCINCHVAGGQSEHTRLVFTSGSGSEQEHANFNVFRDFLASDDHDEHDHDGQTHRQLILYKIQGMSNHGGGAQVSADSEDFRNMDRFLTLLEAEVRAADDDGHDDDHHD
ncbi:MAG: hypothetical protein OXE40_13550, partial [Gammaproteobacteria bacterium]|nr:hypothetical protein [Gammaproteobacteria bacterium]